MAPPRPYGGVDARDRVGQRRRRLLDAGLDLLGGVDQPAELTVRAICATAGTSARYFYESFTDKDQLVADVFDRVVGDLAATTQAAVATAPRGERNRAGIANLVRTIAEDARIGRLLFNPQLSHPVLARKRAELGGFFALLGGRHATDTCRLPDDEWVTAVAHFVVGGVGQTIGAWVSGAVVMERDVLVDRLTGLVDQLAVDRPGAGHRPARPSTAGLVKISIRT